MFQAEVQEGRKLFAQAVSEQVHKSQAGERLGWHPQALRRGVAAVERGVPLRSG